MELRVATYFDVEVIPGPLANEADQLLGTAEDARTLHTTWQVAPQRDDAAYSGGFVPVEEPADALARALDAGQVWGHLDAGLSPRPDPGLDGTRAGRAAGAEGHRKERRSQRCERPESCSEVFFSRGRLGREQLDAEDLGVSELCLHELPSRPNRTDRSGASTTGRSRRRPQYMHPSRHTYRQSRLHDTMYGSS